MNSPRPSPAIVSPGHNGAQQSVLNAIRQGVSDPKAIATWLGMEVSAVRNAIKRLGDAGDIRRKNLGGYEAVKKSCALAETWK